ncbi:MAG TPA: hypothetical protein VHJ79_13655 [Mycobacterium sp.]|jgi:hypothetical protein|nr:hypothetical protein [Mycobacterium sp.]
MIATVQGASAAGGRDELVLDALPLELGLLETAKADVGEDVISDEVEAGDDASAGGRPEVHAVATSATSSARSGPDRRLNLYAGRCRK